MGLSVAVYCGSRFGSEAAYTESARSVGAWIGQQRGTLVYGGGKVGLMGVVADATLNAGGKVFGVIPQALQDREVGHPGLTELHVVQTMHERKLMMAERADAFIALPGGIGTFEELFEVWSWQQLGYHDKPVGLLNVAGYYNELIAFMRTTEKHGFVSREQHDALIVDDQPERLLQRLAGAAQRATAPDDYSKI
jgi:uncharacterized protein (TIGR00730 family)